MIALFLLLPALATAALVNPLLPRDCNADNCLRAVRASAFTARMGTPDCYSYFRTTVTPATSTITATLSFSVTSTVISDVTASTVVPVTTTDTIDVTSTAISDVTVSTVVLVTTTAIVDVTQTSLVTVTVTPPIVKRQVTVVPSSIPAYASACSGAVRYSSACSCIGVTATTITAPTPLTTITISTTVTPTTKTAITTVLTDSITSTANTIFITATDSTVTETTTVLTDSITSVANTISLTTTYSTVTETATATATASASPVCGVNLVQNGDFPAPSFPPFTTSSIGSTEIQFNSECGVDPYCPLFYLPAGGSGILTQTISTYPGQTYTLSYKASSYDATGSSSFSCHVDAAGALPVVANLLTAGEGTFATYSGTFVASGSSTVLTCTVGSRSYFALNVEAIHIEC